MNTYVISTSDDGYREETVPFHVAHELDEAQYWISHAAAKAYQGCVLVWLFNPAGELVWAKRLNSIVVMKKHIQNADLWEEEA